MVCCGLMVKSGGNGITFRPDHALFGSNSPVCRSVGDRVSFPLLPSGLRIPSKGKLTPYSARDTAAKSPEFSDALGHRRVPGSDDTSPLHPDDRRAQRSSTQLLPCT